MARGRIFRVDRGPVVDEYFLDKAGAVFVAAHESHPWNYSPTVMAQALNRFRGHMALPGTVAYSGWELPHGFTKWTDPPGERMPVPTRQPGASMLGLAYGFRIHGDIHTNKLDELCLPAISGANCFVSLHPTRMSSSQQRNLLRNVMFALQAEQGFMALPQGVPLPQFLTDLNWRKAGQVLDDLSGLALDVFSGQTGPSPR